MRVFAYLHVQEEFACLKSLKRVYTVADFVFEARLCSSATCPGHGEGLGRRRAAGKQHPTQAGIFPASHVMDAFFMGILIHFIHFIQHFCVSCHITCASKPRGLCWMLSELDMRPRCSSTQSLSSRNSRDLHCQIEAIKEESNRKLQEGKDEIARVSVAYAFKMARLNVSPGHAYIHR
jgi:hypothetical protein